MCFGVVSGFEVPQGLFVLTSQCMVSNRNSEGASSIAHKIK